MKQLFSSDYKMQSKKSYLQLGIKCDTEFESGKEINDEILEYIEKCNDRKEITWTGGEPLINFTDEIRSFLNKGYFTGNETSGPYRKAKTWTLSRYPKVIEHVIKRTDALTNYVHIRVHRTYRNHQLSNTIGCPHRRMDNQW